MDVSEVLADARYSDDNASVSRFLRVSRGLFVFRYVSSRGGIDAPEVMISQAPGPQVEIITADNLPRAVLRAPGDAIVVRAEQDASIMATVMPVRPGSSRDAQFVFERVAVSPEPVETAAVRGAWSNPVRAAADVSPSILAHVARRGDITVASGDWVCGPHLPMVIEGVQVNWPGRPADVDIEIGCTIHSRGRRVMAPVLSGTFAGTRGKAAPIVGLSLALVGRGAQNYRLQCEALFLGSPIQNQSGALIEFGGPTGHESLVGLRLSVEDLGRSALRSPVPVRASEVMPYASEFGGNDGSAEFLPKASTIAGQAPRASDPPDIIPSVSASNTGRVRVFRASRPSTRT